MQMQLIDLPGTYSLLQSSSQLALDERITADCIKQGDYDCVINVVDAANLERNLYLTCQLIEQGIPLVVVINRIDLIVNQCEINYEALAKRLGCPVLPVCATNRKGIDALVQRIEQPVEPTSTLIDYPPSIQEIIELNAPLSRQACLHFLEAEPSAQDVLDEGEVLKWQQQVHAKEGFEPDIVIAQSRYNWIERQLADCVQTQGKYASQSQIGQKLDKLVLHRIWGIPIFLAVMYSLFFFAINIGGAFQDLFDISSQLIFVDGVYNVCHAFGLGPTVTALLAGGIGKGINTIVTFIPVIGSMFLALSFLEDSGYMARAAFVMDRLMRYLGLPGKSFVPLIVGFGCNVPAIMGTRSLEQRRDRVLTVMISPFMSCGARLAIFTLFVAAFFPTQGSLIVFLLYLIGIGMAVLTGILLKKTWLQGEPDPLVLELPPYQWPRAANLSFHAWRKLKRFVFNAGKLIIPVCLVIGFLNSVTTDFELKTEQSQTTLLEQVGKGVTPVFSPMGISQDNWPATVGLFTGMLAKEVVIGTLNSLYTQDGLFTYGPKGPEYFSEGFSQALYSVPENLLEQFSGFGNPIHTASPKEEVHERIYGEMLSRFDGSAGAFAYLLFVLLYFPCISATAAMLKEVNKRWTMFSVGWTTLVAYTSAVLFYQVATFQLHPLKSTSWLVGIVGLFAVIVLMMRQYKPSKPVPTPIMVTKF